MKFRAIVPALLACVSPLLAAGADTPRYVDYLDWADRHGLVGVFAQPDADLDGDGVTNLMAYALGLEPMTDPDALWDVLPSVDFLGEPPEPSLEFTLPAQLPGDVSYVIECVLADGTRVPVARKTGRAPWKGEARVVKELQKDGRVRVTVYPPEDLELPEEGRPMRLKVEFAP